MNKKNETSRIERAIGAITQRIKDVERLRVDFTAYFRFGQVDGDRMTLHRTDSWTVENLTDRESSYFSQMDIEDKDQPANASLTINSDGRILFQSSEGGLLIPSDREGIKRYQGNTVTLNPKGQPGDAAFVEWKYDVVHQSKDSFTLSLGGFTVGLKIEAEYDPSALDVSIYSLDEAEHTQILAGDSARSTWCFPEDMLFLPSWHMHVLWQPKK